MAKARKPATPMWRPDSAKVRRVIDRLSEQHPDAWTELAFTTPYELLVATVLSAQSSDVRVNGVTPALFTRYPNARALARATTDELEPQIQPTGFFRAKSRALAALSSALVERHGGDVPSTMEELTALPGVGRKTANVVLGHAFGIPGLPVDLHVLRVANRIGIAKSEAPEVVEAQLTGALPDSRWVKASDTLILHGRRICRPKPMCDRCAVRTDCDYYRALGPSAVPASSRSKSVKTSAPKPAGTPSKPARKAAAGRKARS